MDNASMELITGFNKPVEVCRLCLEEGENLPLILRDTNMMLNLNLIYFTIVENFKLTEDPRICAECSEQVKKFAVFKEKITTNECKIKCYQKKKSNFFLQSLCTDLNKVCRLCLTVDVEDYKIFWKDYIKVLRECDIELNMDIDHPSKMCSSCDRILKELHAFNTTSRDKEELINLHFKNKEGPLTSRDLLEVNKIRWRNFFEDLNNAKGDNSSGQTVENKEEDELSDVIRESGKVENNVLQRIHNDWSSSSENDETDDCDNKNPTKSKFQDCVIKANEPRILNHKLCNFKRLESPELCRTSDIAPIELSLEKLSDEQFGSNLLEDHKNSFIAQMKRNFLNNIIAHDSSSEDDAEDIELLKNAKVVEELTIVLDDWDSDEESNENDASQQKTSQRGIKTRNEDQTEESNQEININVARQQEMKTSNDAQTEERSFSPTRQQLVDILEGTSVIEFRSADLNESSVSEKDPLFISKEDPLALTTNYKNTSVSSDSSDEDIVISKSSPIIKKISAEETQHFLRSASSCEIYAENNNINKETTDAQDTIVDRNTVNVESTSSGINKRDIHDKTPVKIIRRGTNSNKIVRNSDRDWLDLVSNTKISKKTARDKVWEELTGKKVNETTDPDMNEMVNNIVLDRLKNNQESDTTVMEGKNTVSGKTRRRGRKRKADVQIIYLEDDGSKKKKSENTSLDSENDDQSEKQKYMFCPTCTYKTKFSESFKQHVALHEVLDSVAKYKCRHCTFQTKDENLLNSHKLIHLDLKLMYSCCVCGFNGPTHKKINVFYHAISNHTTNNGTELEKGFCQVTNKKSKETYLECLFCSFQSTDTNELDIHSKEHKVQSGSLCSIEYELIRCPTCGFTTKRKETIKNHLKICQGGTPLSGVLMPEIIKKMYKCELCGYMTPRMRGLAVHWHKKHNNVTPSADLKRASKDKSKNNVQTQRYAKPEDDSKLTTVYTCALCKNYITHKKGYLLNHIRGKHNAELWECPHCPFDTKYLESYQRHLKLKHNSSITS